MIDGDRLKRLVRVREIVRDGQRAEVVRAELAVEREARGVEDAAHAMSFAVDALASMQDASVAELEARSQAIREARARHDAALARLEARRTEAGAEREALQSAEMEVRSLEVLGERVAKIELRREIRRELVQTDEHALRGRRAR